MKRFLFPVMISLLFSACSPLQSGAVSTPIPIQQPLQTSTEVPEEVIVATEQARAATIHTQSALTMAAQPTFTPPPTFTPTSAHLPTLTPIPNRTPAPKGAFFDVPSDALGSRYEIHNACYFDTQSGWERYEIYAGAITDSGDEYSAQGVVVVRVFRMMARNGEPVVELANTKEYLTLEKKGPLRMSPWDDCTDDYMPFRTPLNFVWHLHPVSGEFYPYDGAPPLARLAVDEKTQIAKLGSHCWNVGCGSGPILPTSSLPLVIRSSDLVHLSLPLDEPPDSLSLSAMFVSPPGIVQYDYLIGDKVEWSYEKPGRELLDLGALPLRGEQDIKISLEPGYYAVTVLAAWRDHGDVKYGFLIEVQE